MHYKILVMANTGLKLITHSTLHTVQGLKMKMVAYGLSPKMIRTLLKSTSMKQLMLTLK